MPKRKRGEPSLEEKLAQWHKELVRGLKTAKGFERQRLSKRIREADPDKTARLEKEVGVLKSLDLQQAAHAHLCSSLLKIKGIAESPKLPAEIAQVPKPSLSEDEKAALHNVTSALCNRKQVKDVIEEAVMGTCIALRVPMPEKKGKTKGKKNARVDKEEQADDRDSDDTMQMGGQPEQPAFEEPVLLKRKPEEAEEEADVEDDEGSSASDSPEFEGFSDSDAEERAFSRYDDFVGGSSDEHELDGDISDGDDFEDSRAKSIRRVAPDDISISSAGTDEFEESEDEALAPPPKKAKSKAVKAAPITAGSSAFLPTLMGGYISGSESASDVDVAPPAKKNRRGQRARQAIWEKKYGEKAKHHEKEKTGRDQGWDMKRGAVGGDEGGPWKKGIRNPFEKQHVHPERQRQMQGERQGQDRGSARDTGYGGGFQEKPKPKAVPKRDDIGTLHPSWAAAKKAKEEGQKIAFQGKKVVFD